jgi:hypothetical protein
LNATETFSTFGTSAATTFLAMNRRLITVTFWQVTIYLGMGNGRHCWNQYDPEMQSWTKMKNNHLLKEAFKLKRNGPTGAIIRTRFLLITS